VSLFENFEYSGGVTLTFWLIRLLVALGIFLLGWALAAGIRRFGVSLLRRLRVDEFSEKLGFEDFLFQGGVRYTASSLGGLILYWFCLFIVFVAALSVLGIEALEPVFARFVGFLPNIFVAVVILIVGLAISRFVREMVSSYLKNIQMKGAKGFGVGVQAVILVFIVSLVLEQLSIGGAILVAGFQILFGSACLALALAFGIGGRKIAQEILEKVWKK